MNEPKEAPAKPIHDRLIGMWDRRAIQLAGSAVALACMLVVGGDVGWAQGTEEGSNERASFFSQYFDFYDPMYIIFGEGKPSADAEENLTFAKFQISFRFELFDFYLGERPPGAPARGVNIAFTQTSVWDLESRSQPFFDSSYQPAAFILYQQLGGLDMSWAHRFDLEGGYQHHSNGKDGLDSRFIDILYVRPTVVWCLFGRSHLFVSPKAWLYLTQSSLNADIEDFFGYLRLDAVWRADFGLQLRTYTWPGGNFDKWTFNGQLTYPLSKLWRPLNFYAVIDYWTGYGETILRYDLKGSGFAFGIAVSR